MVFNLQSTRQRNIERKHSISGEILQGRDFDGMRRNTAHQTLRMAPIYLYLYLQADMSFLNLSGFGTQNMFLLYQRLFNVFLVISASCLCFLATPTFPKVRRLVHFYYQQVIISVYSVFAIGDIAFLFLVERELKTSPIDKCDAFYSPVYCPNAMWSLHNSMIRITFIYTVNNYAGLEFKNAFNITSLYLLALFATLIPLELTAQDIWSQNFALDPSIFVPISQVLVHSVISLRLCYVSEVERLSGVVYAEKIRETNKLKKHTLRTMLPERLIDLSNSIQSRTSVPPLILERFPTVTVMFCSFNETDFANLGSAASCLQLMARCISQFDRIVYKNGLCKVEHVMVDYVVSSQTLNAGPDADYHESPEHVLNIMKTALEFLEVGRQTVDSETNKRLHFRAGIHTGPVIGAVAGRYRRFYRLFGDTVNVAARMYQTAPQESVQISQETEKFIRNTSHEFAIGKVMNVNIKGKGQMNVFLVKPGRLPSSDLVHSDHSAEVSRHSSESSNAEFHLSLASTPATKNEYTFLNKYINEAYMQLVPASSQFFDQELEEEFLKDKAEAGYADTGVDVLLLFFIHALFFLFMTTELQHLTFFERICAAGIAFLVLSGHLILYFWKRHPLIPAEDSVIIHSSMGMSILGMAVYIFVSRSHYSLLGIVYVLAVRHPHELPKTVLSSSVLAVGLCLVLSATSMNQHFTWRFFFTRSPMVVFASFLYDFQSFHARTLRATWKLGKNLNDMSSELDSLMWDLLPSVKAQEFVVNRFQSCGNLASVQSLTPCPDGLMFFKDNIRYASVICADLVGFTPICSALAPQEVVKLLHELWCLWDTRVGKCRPGRTSQFHQPFKMDTVGDAYIVVCMLSDSRHATKRLTVLKMAMLASDIMIETSKYSIGTSPVSLGLKPGVIKLRMGLALGSIVAGVVGLLQPRYHAFGEAVDKAVLLQSRSSPGCLNPCQESLPIIDTIKKERPSLLRI